jgi:hypothetical protein
MIAGISVKHLLENFLRVDLDDHDMGDLEIRDTAGPHWTLHREGVQVGTARYDLEHIIIEIKP